MAFRCFTEGGEAHGTHVSRLRRFLGDHIVDSQPQGGWVDRKPLEQPDLLLIGDVQATASAALPVHHLATPLGLHAGAETDGSLALDPADAMRVMHGALHGRREEPGRAAKQGREYSAAVAALPPADLGYDPGYAEIGGKKALDAVPLVCRARAR